MNIKTLPVGQLETNCYVVINEDTLECVVIDPGDESNTIMDYIESNNLKCKAIMLTHGHFDHVGAVNAVAEQTGCPVYINKRDEGYKVGMSGMMFKLPEGGKYYDDGDVITEAGLEFEVIATPGHTPGGVSLICEKRAFGRYAVPRKLRQNGSARRRYRNGAEIGQKALHASRRLRGVSGHMDSSTLERERRFNHYCREAMANF